MIEKLVNRIGDFHERATVRTVFGEPIVVHGRTIIPVARVWYGFGMGMGEGRRGKGAAPPGVAGRARASSRASSNPQSSASGTEAGAGADGGGGGGVISVRPLAVLEITDKRTTVTPIVDVNRLVMSAILLAAWSVFWIGRAIRAAEKKRP